MCRWVCWNCCWNHVPELNANIIISLSGTEKEPGVIPRAVQDVFSYIEEVSAEYYGVNWTLNNSKIGHQWKRVSAASILHGNIQWKDQRFALCREYKPRDYWGQGMNVYMFGHSNISPCLALLIERYLCPQLEGSHCQDIGRSHELHQRRWRQQTHQCNRLQWTQQSITYHFPIGHWKPLKRDPK